MVEAAADAVGFAVDMIDRDWGEFTEITGAFGVVGFSALVSFK